LECEKKLIGFYKKFHSLKVKTYPSQFQDFEGLFYLMYIPLIKTELDINVLAVDNFKNLKTKLGQVVDHSKDKVLIWRPKNHVSFREVRVSEPEAEGLFEMGIKYFDTDNETKEYIYKELGNNLRMFLILKDEEVLSSSIIGILKDQSYCHIEYFYLKESNNSSKIFQKHIVYLSKRYDIITVEFEQDLISMFTKMNKIGKIIHTNLAQFKKENKVFEFGSNNINLKKDEFFLLLKENQNDKIIKKSKTQQIKYL
jgi:hypothetical protein